MVDVNSPEIDVTLLVDVVVRNALDMLKDLRDKLPTKSDLERRALLVNFCEQTHAECAKLHVLLRWLGSHDQLARSREVIAVLDAIDDQLRQAADALYRVHDAFSVTLAPPFDTRTAIDVLGTGSYNALPRVFDDIRFLFYYCSVCLFLFFCFFFRSNFSHTMFYLFLFSNIQSSCQVIETTGRRCDTGDSEANR